MNFSMQLNVFSNFVSIAYRVKHVEVRAGFTKIIHRTVALKLQGNEVCGRYPHVADKQNLTIQCSTTIDAKYATLQLGNEEQSVATIQFLELIFKGKGTL